MRRRYSARAATAQVEALVHDTRRLLDAADSEPTLTARDNFPDILDGLEDIQHRLGRITRQAWSYQVTGLVQVIDDRIQSLERDHLLPVMTGLRFERRWLRFRERWAQLFRALWRTGVLGVVRTNRLWPGRYD